MNTLLQPFIVFWILLLLGVILFKLKRFKLLRGVLILAIAQLFVFGVSPLSVWITRNLEQEYPAFQLDGQLDPSIPIVVLGGGHTNDSTLTAIQKLHLSSLNRLTTGISIYQRNTNPPGVRQASKLITTGYSSSEQTSAATVMANAAVELGVHPKDTITLITPANTWQETLSFKTRFPDTKKLYLVTSALHMPRAMETFEYHGLEPIAVPTDFLVKKDPEKSVYSWRPEWRKLEMTQRSLHEVLGIWYYRWFKQN